MMKRNKLLIILYFISLALLFLASTVTKSVSTTWNVGNKYQINQKQYSYSHRENIDYDIHHYNEFEIYQEFRYNITNINNISKIVYYDREVLGSITSTSNSYDPAVFVTQRLQLNTILSTMYMWDFHINKTKLVQIDLAINPVIFLEANWSIINDHFKNNVLNQSSIINTINDPYTPSLIHNITLGDFFNNATTFEIMEIENNLVEAREHFTQEAHKWSFSFDFSNALYYAIFNSSSGNYDYIPYEKYTLLIELEYSDGGALVYYHNNKETIVTINKEKFTSVSENTLSQGDIIETAATGFNCLIVFSAVVCFIIIVRCHFKRKKAY